MEQSGASEKDELNNRSINVYLRKGLEVIIPEQTHSEDNVLRICIVQFEKNPLCKYVQQKRHYYSRISSYKYATPNSS
jgi:hypothetical protein